MQVLIAGGAGFLGTSLVAELGAGDHWVTVVTRRPDLARRAVEKDVAVVGWRDLPRALKRVDAVINLAGASIGEGRWTARRKAELVRSRLDSTHTLVKALAQVQPRPKVLINASAVGYYGDRPEKVDELSAPGDDFLAGLCRQWEEAAEGATPLGVRVVRMRLGVVLGRGGGALRRMLPPFRFFAGGPMGSGRQGFPWVHQADAMGLFRFALENEAVVGPVNAVAPEMVDNASFARALGRALGRPSWLPVPGFALRALLGEMAGPLLLSGQFVRPAAAEKFGYHWRFPKLVGALDDLFRQ